MRQNATLQGLSPKQRKAVEALVATGEVAAAAQQLGLSRATLHRWLADPTFLQAVRAAEAQAMEDLSRLLVRLGRTAAATLAKAMSDTGTPMSTRVRAADAVLARLLQVRTVATLDARVAEMEQEMGLLDEAVTRRLGPG